MNQQSMLHSQGDCVGVDFNDYHAYGQNPQQPNNNNNTNNNNNNNQNNNNINENRLSPIIHHPHQQHPRNNQHHIHEGDENNLVDDNDDDDVPSIIYTNDDSRSHLNTNRDTFGIAVEEHIDPTRMSTTQQQQQQPLSPSQHNNQPQSPLSTNHHSLNQPQSPTSNHNHNVQDPNNPNPDDDDNGEETKDQLDFDDIPESAVLEIPLTQMFRFATGLDYFLIIIAIFASIVSGGLMPAMAIVIGMFVEKVSTGVSILASVLTIAYILLVFGAVATVVAYLNISLWMTLAERQCRAIRYHYLLSLLRSEIAYHDMQAIGEIMVKLVANIDKVRDGIGQKLGQVIQSICGFIIGLGIAFYYGWALSLVIIACIPPLLVFSALFSGATGKATSGEQIHAEKAGGIASQTFSGITVVKALRLEDWQLYRYITAQKDWLSISMTKGWLQGLSLGVFMLFIYTIYGVGFHVGGVFISQRRAAWPGVIYDGARVLTIFYALVLSVTILASMSPQLRAISTAKCAAFPLFETIDRVGQIDPFATTGKHISPEQFTGKVRFDLVTFQYPSRAQLILLDLDLEFQPGYNALIGGSGCGKSTVLQLISRYYDPDHGQIYIEVYDDDRAQKELKDSPFCSNLQNSAKRRLTDISTPTSPTTTKKSLNQQQQDKSTKNNNLSPPTTSPSQSNSTLTNSTTNNEGRQSPPIPPRKAQVVFYDNSESDQHLPQINNSNSNTNNNNTSQQFPPTSIHTSLPEERSGEEDEDTTTTQEQQPVLKRFTKWIPIHELHVQSYRNLISVCHQEPVVFAGTVRENLIIGKADANDDDMYTALEYAGLAEFVKSLPSQLDQLVSNKVLSGGQQQRLCFARALIADPQILLLDEFCASLDIRTQHIVHEGLAKWISLAKQNGHNKTVISVTHKLSTIRHADQIYALNQGHVEQQGTHDELYQDLDGYYRRLLTDQLAFEEEQREIQKHQEQMKAEFIQQQQQQQNNNNNSTGQLQSPPGFKSTASFASPSLRHSIRRPSIESTCTIDFADPIEYMTVLPLSRNDSLMSSSTQQQQKSYILSLIKNNNNQQQQQQQQQYNQQLLQQVSSPHYLNQPLIIPSTSLQPSLQYQTSLLPHDLQPPNGTQSHFGQQPNNQITRIQSQADIMGNGNGFNKQLNPSGSTNNINTNNNHGSFPDQQNSHTDEYVSIGPFDPTAPSTPLQINHSPLHDQHGTIFTVQQDNNNNNAESNRFRPSSRNPQPQLQQNQQQQDANSNGLYQIASMPPNVMLNDNGSAIFTDNSSTILPDDNTSQNTHATLNYQLNGSGHNPRHNNNNQPHNQSNNQSNNSNLTPFNPEQPLSMLQLTTDPTVYQHPQQHFHYNNNSNSRQQHPTLQPLTLQQTFSSSTARQSGVVLSNNTSNTPYNSPFILSNHNNNNNNPNTRVSLQHHDLGLPQPSLMRQSSKHHPPIRIADPVQPRSPRGQIHPSATLRQSLRNGVFDPTSPPSFITRQSSTNQSGIQPQQQSPHLTIDTQTSQRDGGGPSSPRHQQQQTPKSPRNQPTSPRHSSFQQNNNNNNPPQFNHQSSSSTSTTEMFSPGAIQPSPILQTASVQKQPSLMLARQGSSALHRTSNQVSSLWGLTTFTTALRTSQIDDTDTSPIAYSVATNHDNQKRSHIVLPKYSNQILSQENPLQLQRQSSIRYNPSTVSTMDQNGRESIYFAPELIPDDYRYTTHHGLNPSFMSPVPSHHNHHGQKSVMFLQTPQYAPTSPDDPRSPSVGVVDFPPFAPDPNYQQPQYNYNTNPNDEQQQLQQNELRRIGLTQEEHENLQKEFNAQIKPTRIVVPVFQNLFKFTNKYPILMTVGIICTCIEACGTPAYAMLLKYVLDAFFLPDTASMLNKTKLAAILFFCIGLGYLIFATARVGLLTMAGEKVTHDIRKLAFRIITFQDLYFFDLDEHTQAILSTLLANDVTYIRVLITDLICDFFMCAAMFIASVAISYQQGWQLTTVMLALLPILTGCAIIQHYFLSRSSQSKYLLDHPTQHVSEALSNIRVIATYRQEQRVLKHFIDAADSYCISESKKAQIAGVWTGLSYTVLFGAYALCFWFGGWLIQRNQLQTMGLIQIFTAMQMTAGIISQKIQLAASYSSALQHSMAIFNLISSEKPKMKVYYAESNDDDITCKLLANASASSSSTTTTPATTSTDITTKSSDSTAVVDTTQPKGGDSNSNPVNKVLPPTYHLTDQFLLDNVQLGIDIIQAKVTQEQEHAAQLKQNKKDGIKDNNSNERNSNSNNNNNNDNDKFDHTITINQNTNSNLPSSAQQSSMRTTGGGHQNDNDIEMQTTTVQSQTTTMVISKDDTNKNNSNNKTKLSTKDQAIMLSQTFKERLRLQQEKLLNRLTTFTISFKQVTFAYPTRPQQIVFNALDLIIPGGKYTCIVGTSGSGKSSILSLLLRLYDPTPGLQQLFQQQQQPQQTSLLHQSTIIGVPSVSYLGPQRLIQQPTMMFNTNNSAFQSFNQFSSAAISTEDGIGTNAPSQVQSDTNNNNANNNSTPQLTTSPRVEPINNNSNNNNNQNENGLPPSTSFSKHNDDLVLLNRNGEVLKNNNNATNNQLSTPSNGHSQYDFNSYTAGTPSGSRRNIVKFSDLQQRMLDGSPSDQHQSPSLISVNVPSQQGSSSTTTTTQPTSPSMFRSTSDKQDSGQHSQYNNTNTITGIPETGRLPNPNSNSSNNNTPLGIVPPNSGNLSPLPSPSALSQDSINRLPHNESTVGPLPTTGLQLNFLASMPINVETSSCASSSIPLSPLSSNNQHTREQQQQQQSQQPNNNNNSNNNHKSTDTQSICQSQLTLHQDDKFVTVRAAHAPPTILLQDAFNDPNNNTNSGTPGLPVLTRTSTTQSSSSQVITKRIGAIPPLQTVDFSQQLQPIGNHHELTSLQQSCGAISIDGVDIRTLTNSTLRSLIGFVSQFPVLFTGSIMDNLKCGHDHITDESVYEACRMANIHNVIMGFSDKYDTILSGTQSGLSGGQRMRLSLARSLVLNCPILLLDEIHSNLDAESADAINIALQHFVKGKTVILIAHRLDLVANSDHIIVLHQGKVVEQGNHDFLLSNGGWYRDLYQTSIGQQ